MSTWWFDLTNTPHVHFFKPFIEEYCGRKCIIVTGRDFSETMELARNELEIEPIKIGKYAGRGKVRKVCALCTRIMKMSLLVPDFDMALSCGGVEASFIARMRRKPVTVFDDNETSANWLYSRFADHAFFPDAIDIGILLKQGFKASAIHQYDGYKEDIYLASYQPNNSFYKTLPFRDYVVVRPENFMASYLRNNGNSIVPSLLRALVKKGYNVLFLPRHDSDRQLVHDMQHVYVPPSSINGLDAVFFSQAVLSGAGTLTREAACMGKPAVSFYAGRRFLAVDRQMIRVGWLHHSRNVDEIIRYIATVRPRRINPQRSRAVQAYIFETLDRIADHNKMTA